MRGYNRRTFYPVEPRLERDGRRSVAGAFGLREEGSAGGEFPNPRPAPKTMTNRLQHAAGDPRQESAGPGEAGPHSNLSVPIRPLNNTEAARGDVCLERTNEGLSR